MTNEERKGPIESRAWPSRLDAFAVDTSGSPRLFGYDVEDDLVRHYRFTDLFFLSLTGELPPDPVSKAFEAALSMSLPSSVADAPTHAAILAAHCGAGPGALLSGVTAAAADAVTSELGAFCALFANPPSALPEGLRATSPNERSSVQRLDELTRGLVEVPLLALEPRRDLALLAVFWACGLRTPLQLVSVAVMARLPSAIAEATPRRVEDFGRYPTDTPLFVYEE